MNKWRYKSIEKNHEYRQYQCLHLKQCSIRFEIRSNINLRFELRSIGVDFIIYKHIIISFLSPYPWRIMMLPKYESTQFYLLINQGLPYATHITCSPLLITRSSSFLKIIWRKVSKYCFGQYWALICPSERRMDSPLLILNVSFPKNKYKLRFQRNDWNVWHGITHTTPTILRNRLISW